MFPYPPEVIGVLTQKMDNLIDFYKWVSVPSRDEWGVLHCGSTASVLPH